MLVCPRCQFENPTANKFCQKCGTSLTQNTCPECDSLVDFNQLDCQNCGAVAGVTWWAIVFASPQLNAESGSPPAIAIGSNQFLDLQHRYQMLADLVEIDKLGERQGQVLDCHPFQLSLLEALVLKNAEAEIDDLSFSDKALGREGWADSMEALTIPAIAHPYLALGNQYFPVLPTIHNAWSWGDQAVLLLENRAEYPQLIDLWSSDHISLPLLQVLQWLYEMVDLWQGLEAWQCQQSLLVVDNLRAEAEDYTLCLQRLYVNPAGDPPTLRNLGHLWRIMFSESQKTHVEAISQLLIDMEDEKLTTVDQVKTRIEAIAQSLQPQPSGSASDTAAAGMEFSPSAQGFTPRDGTNPLDASFSLPDVNAATTRLELPLDESDRQLVEAASMDSDEMPTIVLPMQLFNLEEVGRTDVGRQRDHNEDYFGIETQIAKLESPSGKTMHARNLYILCDGMGGHAGGEVASALAVDTIRSYFQNRWQEISFPGDNIENLPDVTMMTEAVLLANKAIYDVNQQNARSGSGRMGTTLVLVLIHDTEVAIAHVGDSRLYRYTRKRSLEQITVDHEVGQREIQRGIDPEVAYARPDAYQLTQALGPRDEHFVKPDVQFFELNEDMLLLLCSDGLSDNDLLEKNVDTHIQPLLSSQTNLDKGVSELMELANRYNGHDNITAIAIRAKVRPSLEHLR